MCSFSTMGATLLWKYRSLFSRLSMRFYFSISTASKRKKKPIQKYLYLTAILGASLILCDTVFIFIIFLLNPIQKIKTLIHLKSGKHLIN